MQIRNSLEFAILKNTVFVFFWEPTKTGDRICFILQQKMELHDWEQKSSMKKKSFFFLETCSSQNMIRLLEAMTCKFFGSCSFWGLIFFFFDQHNSSVYETFCPCFNVKQISFLLLVGCVFKIVVFEKRKNKKRHPDWPLSKRT